MTESPHPQQPLRIEREPMLSLVPKDRSWIGRSLYLWKTLLSRATTETIDSSNASGGAFDLLLESLHTLPPPHASLARSLAAAAIMSHTEEDGEGKTAASPTQGGGFRSDHRRGGGLNNTWGMRLQLRTKSSPLVQNEVGGGGGRK